MMDLVCRQGGLPVRVRTCLHQVGADRRKVLKAEQHLTRISEGSIIHILLRW